MNMLTSITLENFKGVKAAVRIPLRPITLMFGANSSGKSTIIQAIHYAREILQNRNTDVDRTSLGGDSIDLGGFRNLVHDHDVGKAIILRFDLDLNNVDLPVNWYASVYHVGDEPPDIGGSAYAASIEITISWSSVLGNPILKSSIIGINDEPFARLTSSFDQTNFTWEYNAKHTLWDLPAGDWEWRGDLPDSESTLWPELKIGPSDLPSAPNTAFPLWDDIPLVIQKSESESESFPAAWVPISYFVVWFTQLVTGPTKILLSILNNLRYLGPIRRIPERNHQPILTPDESRWADGTAAWDALHRSDEMLIDEANYWMSGEHLKTGYSVRLDRYRELPVASPLALALSKGTLLDDIESTSAELDQYPIRERLVLIEDANRLELQPQDIGIGISQVVPVIVMSLVTKDGIVALEQPELHLHPAIQAQLGDLFIESAKRGNTLIIETHSEHLLLRLMRRIRQSTAGKITDEARQLSSKDIVVLFVEVVDERTIVREMPINDEGELVKAWPGGFFEEGLNEMF